MPRHANGVPAEPEQIESQVRAYSRSWPISFCRASGDWLYASSGKAFLDFFMGAGALNYGHNDPLLREALIKYLSDDGVVHSLDMLTEAKVRLLETLRDVLLQPRGLDYVVQFTGPTGANAVEAALKLARKVTGRTSVASFTRSFHGVSLGALAVTASPEKRAGAGTPLEHVLRLPFEGHGSRGVSGLDLLEDMVEDVGSGIDLPAAAIIETLQGEGGVNPASQAWLRRLGAICQRAGILLIVDDIQMGCGRTGPFFSFEDARLVPDIVCLSKSLSGYGLPMSLTLFRSELDVWLPGEHNGTFRGNNPAFVTAAAALEAFWSDPALEASTREKGEIVAAHLKAICERYAAIGARYRGKGLIWGLEFDDHSLAHKVGVAAFERQLLVETSGPRDEVVKLSPSLLISVETLVDGLGVFANAVEDAATGARAHRPPPGKTHLSSRRAPTDLEAVPPVK